MGGPLVHLSGNNQFGETNEMAVDGPLSFWDDYTARSVTRRNGVNKWEKGSSYLSHLAY